MNVLEEKAKWVRRQVLEMIVSAGKGHIGGSLSCIEILVSLYYGGILRYNPSDPTWDGRDRFIMSKGHGCQSLYAILADLDFFPISELSTFGKEGSRLEGHPNRSIPGIDVTTGSLGHGLGIGAGMALRGKLDEKNFKVIVLLSDGDCYEGSTWEAAMFASHHKLDNLVAIIDRNYQVVLDYTEECNQLEPLADKWKAFGWHTEEIDGHSFKDLLHIGSPTSCPRVIIANTIKGKGISFMEGKVEWHHSVPVGSQLELARSELSGY